MAEIPVILPEVKVARNDPDLVFYETLPSIDAKRDWLRENMIKAWAEWDDPSRKKGPEGMHPAGDFEQWSKDPNSSGCLLKSAIEYGGGRHAGALFPNTPDGDRLKEEIATVWRIFQARARLESDPNTAVDVLAIKDAVANVSGEDIKRLMEMRVDAGGADGADAFAHIETKPILRDSPLALERTTNPTDALLNGWGGSNNHKFIMQATRDFYMISGRVSERSKRAGVPPADRSEWYKSWMAVMAKILNPDMLLMDAAQGRSSWTRAHAGVMSAGIGSYVTEIVNPVSDDPVHRRPWDLRGKHYTAEEMRGASWATKKALPLYFLDVVKTTDIVKVIDAYNADSYDGWRAMLGTMAKSITEGRLFGQLLPDKALALTRIMYPVTNNTFEFIGKNGRSHSIHWLEMKRKLPPGTPDSAISARSMDMTREQLAGLLINFRALLSDTPPDTQLQNLADRYCGGYRNLVRNAQKIPGEHWGVAGEMLKQIGQTGIKTFSASKP